MVEKIKQDEKFRSLYLSMNLHDRDLIKEATQQKAIEVAINAFKIGLTPEQITKVTGLSLEQVLELQEQITENA